MTLTEAALTYGGLLELLELLIHEDSREERERIMQNVEELMNDISRPKG